MKFNLNYQIALCSLFVLSTFSLFSQCNNILTPSSSILDSDGQASVISWLPAGFEYQADLVYESAVSGSNSSLFHAACDGLSNTLLVAVTEEGYIYGGYNEGVWSSDGGTQSGLDNNFLFSITLNEVYPAIPGETHITNTSAGLRFGGSTSPDLSYFSNVNENVLTLNNLGNSYQCPASASDCQLHLNGNLDWNDTGDRFETASWEIWQLNTSGTPIGEYCEPAFSSGCTSDYTNSFETEGALMDISHANSGCSNADAYDFYSEHQLVSEPGADIAFNIQFATFDQRFTIAIDFNQNNLFEDSEIIASNTDSRVEFFDGSFTIPAGIEPGNYRMRVQNFYNTVTDYSCLETTWGEVEDYPVQIVGTESVGCTYESAINYNPSVLIDDGSCAFNLNTGCIGDLNGDDSVGAGDLTIFLANFGTDCSIIPD